MAPLSVHILYNKTNTYGLAEDAAVIDRVLKKLQDVIGQPIGISKHLDIREPLTHCDIQFHLETPIFGAIPWAHTNILLVNPEQWALSYDEYVHAFDLLLFRDPVSAIRFTKDLELNGLRHDHVAVVPWCGSWQVKDIADAYGKTSDFGFVAFVAGSTSKYEYLKKIVPYWKQTDPALRIYTTRSDFEEGLKAVIPAGAPNVVVKCQELDEPTRRRLMTLYRGHIVCSQGEAYGYAAANAEVAGAFTLMNRLPVFEMMYHDATASNQVAWLSNTYEESSKVRYAFASPCPDTIRAELDAAFAAFRVADVEAIRVSRQAVADTRFLSTCEAFLPYLHKIHGLVKERQPKKGGLHQSSGLGVHHCPPVLNVQDCPPITIVTPTYNRKELIDIAFHNLLATDYPHDKIEWIVIEDNEKTPHMASEKVISFQIQVPKINIKYIPIEGRMSIGEKRNHAIEHASHDIILFMDDDDHYPSTSFRRRVAWLTKGTKAGKTGEANIVCCTTIALYDLKRGVSAVNVPPFDIPLAQRVSEATLTFKKSAWLERKFSHVSMAEGEDWISGREDQVIEMPAQQIIVAFSHGGNQSSRRIPPTDSQPACFWGFPREYLLFIHKLAGVEVEEDTSNGKKP